MFENLSDRLGKVFDKITGRGSLSEADVDEALAEVRKALLEADVALDVTKEFITQVRAKAVGADILKSVKPGQMVIKIVHDELVRVLGSDAKVIDLNAPAPVGIMMVGLQGSGKTTTTAKIAKRLQDKQNKKVLMASLDTRRPAAQEQLRVLGEANNIATLEIIAGQTPVQIAKRAEVEARRGGFDVVIFDTAGRTTLDDELMQEAAEIKAATNPHEILLVADSLTGQDAVNTAKAFLSKTDLTGIVLTRVDGDGRGGAALSMRAVTGKPIKLLGIGEKMDALEEFHPERIASRILDMGDIVSLVERAAENIDAAKAEAAAKRMAKGEFTLDDMAGQLEQMLKMGGLAGLMGMMPGIGKIKNQMAAANLDDRVIKRQIATISSMTKAERKDPHKILNFSRKKRIAAGAGTSLEDINKVLKMHRGMADMMKMMSRGKGGGLAQALGGMFGMGGGTPTDMPPMPQGMKMPSMEDIAKLQGQMPKGFTLPSGFGGSTPKLPGLGSTGFGGLGGLSKKKD